MPRNATITWSTKPSVCRAASQRIPVSCGVSSSQSPLRIVILGTAYPYRGGLAAYNERLAREFQHLGHEVDICTFRLQYPGFLFPGKSQFSSDPAPEGLRIHRLVHAIQPLNWLRAGRTIRRMKPDLIVVKFWIPFMGPALGTVLRWAKRGKSCRVVCILDNVIPHEHRPGDRLFTRYFLKACDAFVAMSHQVLEDLRTFTQQPAVWIPHPLYDHFGTRMSRQEARSHLGLPQDGKLLLFFGFIRRYKGLDLLLEAMADPRIREQHIRLLVAGEFYEPAQPYLDQIQHAGLEDLVVLHTDYIPDSEVKYYFCAADAVVQPYRSATQSGITPMAYHFERPMIVTRVGGLTEIVPDGQVGLVCEPEAASLTEAMLKFYTFDPQHFLTHVREEKQKYGWDRMAQAVLELHDVQK